MASHAVSVPSVQVNECPFPFIVIFLAKLFILIHFLFEKVIFEHNQRILEIFANKKKLDNTCQIDSSINKGNERSTFSYHNVIFTRE